MTVAWGIMAHPSRVRHVNVMLGKLTAQGAWPVNVAVDAEGLGCWGNAKRAWLMGDRTASHQVLLQDDIMFCLDFVQQAERCARLRPDDPVSFFLARKSVTSALNAGVNWVQTRRFLGAQAVLMPTRMVTDFLEWEDRHHEPSWGRSQDWRMQMYFKERKLLVFIPVPTLVEHRIDMKSTMSHAATSWNRTSRCYIGDAGRGEVLPLDNLTTELDK